VHNLADLGSPILIGLLAQEAGTGLNCHIEVPPSMGTYGNPKLENAVKHTWRSSFIHHMSAHSLQANTAKNYKAADISF
jgi:hypothetical protein